METPHKTRAERRREAKAEAKQTQRIVSSTYHQILASRGFRPAPTETKRYKAAQVELAKKGMQL